MSSLHLLFTLPFFIIFLVGSTMLLLIGTQISLDMKFEEGAITFWKPEYKASVALVKYSILWLSLYALFAFLQSCRVNIIDFMLAFICLCIVSGTVDRCTEKYLDVLIGGYSWIY